MTVVWVWATVGDCW